MGGVHYVYVLKSDKDGKRYIGMTNDIDRRLREHRSGKTFSIRGRGTFSLTYVEKYNTRNEARKRERYFKTSAGRRWLSTKVETTKEILRP